MQFGTDGNLVWGGRIRNSLNEIIRQEVPQRPKCKTLLLYAET
jgi:hypothetical protein